MYANDREAILICIRTCTGIDMDRARVVRIRSTAEMEEIQVSESLLDELRGRDDVEILGEPEEMAFDAEGNLTD